MCVCEFLSISAAREIQDNAVIMSPKHVIAGAGALIPLMLLLFAFVVDSV